MRVCTVCHDSAYSILYFAKILRIQNKIVEFELIAHPFAFFSCSLYSHYMSQSLCCRNEGNINVWKFTANDQLHLTYVNSHLCTQGPVSATGTARRERQKGQ